MARKKMSPAAVVAIVLATGPLSGVAPLVSAADAAMPVATAPALGVIKQRSDFGFEQTIDLLKADIAKKGIRFFDEINQQQLGAGADLPIGRSTLLLFGNPPLGVQFLQSNPLAGLDWPVRMLVTEEADGTVWLSWTDFRFIADRYQLTDRDPQIAMASVVSASIASAARKQP
ncbi:MAG: DUF302 domain-containing protein [Sphingomicrobium sp.]